MKKLFPIGSNLQTHDYLKLDFQKSGPTHFGNIHFKLRNFVVVAMECFFALVDKGVIITRIQIMVHDDL